MSQKIEKPQTVEAQKGRKMHKPADSPTPDALSLQREKNQALVRLLREWMADESGQQEKEWPIIKKALEEDHPSYRRLFND